jgi:hypothetical protein
MQDFISILMDGQSQQALAFARDQIEKDAAATGQYGLGDARSTDLETWGITREQWSHAMRAVTIARLASKLTSRFPVVSFSNQPNLRTTEQRLCLEAGQYLRPMIIESWLGRDVDVIDEIAVSEMAKALPDGWTLLLEGRSSNA